MSDLKSQAISSVKWNAISQVVKIGLYFVTTAILARLLQPEDFGILGLAMIFTSLVAIFNDFGLGSTIIQRQDLDDDFLSTVFWLALGMGLLSFLLTILFAPLIAIFFDNSLVNGLLQGLSITFLITALMLVPQSLAMKELNFKKVMIVESLSLLIGSTAAIIAAFMNFGVWAFVLQSIITCSVSMVGFWVTSHWKPSFRFHRRYLREVLNYSSGLFGFNFVNFFSRNSDNFLIGKFLGTAPLGLYSIAYRLMQYPIQNITGVINRVLFPTLTRVSDDNLKFIKGYIQASQLVATVLFPLLSGMLCLAEEFTLVIFGAKWEGAVPVIRILVSAGIFQTIGVMIGVIYTAKGETRKFFYWGLFSSIVAVISIVVGLQWGIIGVAACYALATFALFIPSLIIPFKFIELSLFKYLRALAVPALLSVIMSLIVVGVKTLEKSLGFSQLVILITSIIIGGLSYIIGNWKFNRPVFSLLQSQFRLRNASTEIGKNN